MKSVVAFACLIACLALVNALDNGLARTPQMGWNSWSHFGCGVNEGVIQDTIKLIKSTGLYKFGYNYVNIDDCWAYSRNATGYIQSDPTSFPNGIKPLADAAHAAGLMFGVYSDAGIKTCAGRPGSLGFETNDARSYASWGVDYLKYDNCNNNGISPQVRYPIMRDALNATKRTMFYSLCEWGVDDPASWAASVGNSWRTTADLADNWQSMLNNIDENNLVAEYAAPGGWNDPDLLDVGNGGMTTVEYTSHFSLWALSKAPLIITCDLSKMTTDTYTILTNTEVIAIDQDSLGVQGKVVKNYAGNSTQVWAGPLSGGAYTVILFNRGSSTTSITANWSDFGVQPATSFNVRDLWLHQNLGKFTKSFTGTVASHGVIMLKLTPA